MKVVVTFFLIAILAFAAALNVQQANNAQSINQIKAKQAQIERLVVSQCVPQKP